MTTFDNDAYKDVNFKKVYNTANELLISAHSITDFPFVVKDFVYSQSDIRLCSFRKAQEKYGVTIQSFGSDSAVLQEMFGAYIIFFDQDEKATRVRFSLLHEFGHYALKHKMNLTEKDKLYHTQELEANCFAAQLLMPEQILRECINRNKKITTSFLQDNFGVSFEAADKRKKTLANTSIEWRSRAERDFDELILLKYADALNRIAPKPISFYNLEDDYEKQRERDTWLDTRSRWT